MSLIDLLSVTAPLGESSPSPRRLAEHDVAATAQDDALGVTENGRDLEASGTLDVHEEAVRALYEALELVRACLEFGRWVQEIDGHLVLLLIGCRKILTDIGRGEGRW